MASVDLVCTYNEDTEVIWTNGSAISTANGVEASYSVGPGGLVGLSVSTNAASVIPVGVTITDVRVVVKARTSAGASGGVYLKTPGGFVDGGAAGHTVVIGAGTGTYVSENVLLERPAVAADSLTALVFRLYNEGVTQSLLVDYIALRVVYETSTTGVPILFMNESF